MAANGKQPRQLLASWNQLDYDWSPDSKWIAYAAYDDDFNRDIFVVPLDGSREPFNISRHPDNDSGPVWSPDGKALAFTGRRLGSETDIYYLYLEAEKAQEESRDRKLQEAIEKITKARKKGADKPGTAKPDDGSKPDSDETEDAGKPSEKESAEANKEKPPEVKIDFDGLIDRVQRISIPNTDESDLLWSPDSKKLAFSATIDGKRGTYTVSPPDNVSPTLLSTQTGRRARWLAQGKQIVWLVGGVPASLSATGSATTYSFSAPQSVDRAERFQAAFLQCWRAMRDNFYDGNLNNRNWDGVYRKYARMARDSVDESMLTNVVNLMLGELNGSHLGFSARREGSPANNNEWKETTVHFGLRFDRDYRGPGLKVRDVICDSPADKQRSKIEPGEIVLSINGKAIDPDMDITTILNGRLDQDYVLQVRNNQEEMRDVTLRPISYSESRALLYEHWVRANRRKVDEASQGKLAYLHIRGMNMSSFYRFEQELFAIASGKDGIVIDVRENGGGSTTDHLLTILAQPVHAITVPRGGQPGYPQDRKVYASWHKPIVVLCNQNSFSNAEIFSHAIKTLKRGKLVGVPTAGGVISTGGTMIMDIGFLRMPFRGWFLTGDGQDMELNGAVPNVVIWPRPGEMPAGFDRQLDKAIQLLSADVEKWNSRKRPELIKASDRKSE
jgi:tricorn protease